MGNSASNIKIRKDDDKNDLTITMPDGTIFTWANPNKQPPPQQFPLLVAPAQNRNIQPPPIIQLQPLLNQQQQPNMVRPPPIIRPPPEMHQAPIPPVQQRSVPAVRPNQPFSTAPGFVKIPNPSPQDIQLAASIFNQAAAWSQIKYAIIGGFSAQIYGGNRLTKSLDILIAPRKVGNQFLLRPVIDELFDKNPQLLNYTGSNRHGHIVITDGIAGVPITFIDCINNIYNFPDLIAPARPDGTPWGHDDPEPTYTFRQIYPLNLPTGLAIPVLHPRILLGQRVWHFDRYSEGDVETRKKNDIKDIIVYLNLLQGTENESFSDAEARALIAKVRDVARFAKLYWFSDAADVGKWRYINIPLVEEDLNRDV
jgi:hypothetical protein